MTRNEAQRSIRPFYEVAIYFRFNLCYLLKIDITISGRLIPQFCGDKTMKPVFFMLCLFFSLVIAAGAGDLYRCTDSNGKTIITDNPSTGMKNCVFFTDSDSETSPGETPTEHKKDVGKKDKAAAAKQDTDEEKIRRINNCINCCNNKIDVCYNYTADSRLCMAESQRCVATCKSEGSTPSSWSDCWTQSKE